MLTQIVRLLLFLTRPQVAPPPRKKKLPFSVEFYKWLLIVLTQYYRRYAAEDTIAIGRDIKIVRICRDSGFESELKRMGINIKPHWEDISLKLSKTKTIGRRRRPFISFFSFTDELFVTVSQSELVIDRTDCLDVIGSIGIKVKRSSGQDIIERSSSHINFGTKTVSETPEQRKTGIAAKRRVKSGIFVAEKNPLQERPLETAEEKHISGGTTIVRGIEIDDDF